jgi:hypothetical protein
VRESDYSIFVQIIFLTQTGLKVGHKQDGTQFSKLAFKKYPEGGLSIKIIFAFGYFNNLSLNLTF